jgi:hypothetical protein
VQDGRISLGDLGDIMVAVFTGMEPIDATGKALKLTDKRITFKATPNGMDKEVSYTVALLVQREPVNSEETAKVEVKAALQAANKARKAADLQATEDRQVRRAVELTQQAERDAANRLVEAHRTIAASALALSR